MRSVLGYMEQELKGMKTVGGDKLGMVSAAGSDLFVSLVSEVMLSSHDSITVAAQVMYLAAKCLIMHAHSHS